MGEVEAAVRRAYAAGYADGYRDGQRETKNAATAASGDRRGGYAVRHALIPAEDDYRGSNWAHYPACRRGMVGDEGYIDVATWERARTLGVNCDDCLRVLAERHEWQARR